MAVTSMWKDGLPDDPLERAQKEQILKSAGLTSAFSSLMRLHDGDGVAAAEELKRIEEERNALKGAAQPQPNEGTPQKAELAKAQVERGEKGTANDRG